MSVKKKTKFIIFKFFKDLAVITLINFNKKRVFKTFSNFNINTKLILYDFKLIISDVFTADIN